MLESELVVVGVSETIKPSSASDCTTAGHQFSMSAFGYDYTFPRPEPSLEIELFCCWSQSLVLQSLSVMMRALLAAVNVV